MEITLPHNSYNHILNDNDPKDVRIGFSNSCMFLGDCGIEFNVNSFSRLLGFKEVPSSSDIWYKIAEIVIGETDPDSGNETTTDKVVDRDKLLEIADDMIERQRFAATGATDGVVDAGCLRDYAEQIRKVVSS